MNPTPGLFGIQTALRNPGRVAGCRGCHRGGLFGQIYYPIYITHYPLIYLYTAWVGGHHLPMSQAYPYALLVLFASIALAYACLKLYDEPARNWLKKRFLMERLK